MYMIFTSCMQVRPIGLSLPMHRCTLKGVLSLSDKGSFGFLNGIGYWSCQLRRGGAWRICAGTCPGQSVRALNGHTRLRTVSLIA